jgi:hypothetical protein
VAWAIEAWSWSTVIMPGQIDPDATEERRVVRRRDEARFDDRGDNGVEPVANRLNVRVGLYRERQGHQREQREHKPSLAHEAAPRSTTARDLDRPGLRRVGGGQPDRLGRGDFIPSWLCE